MEKVLRVLYSDVNMNQGGAENIMKQFIEALYEETVRGVWNE